MKMRIIFLKNLCQTNIPSCVEIRQFLVQALERNKKLKGGGLQGNCFIGLPMDAVFMEILSFCLYIQPGLNIYMYICVDV